VIVGGSGYFFGPFVGGLVAILAPEWLRFTEGYYLIIYAMLVMVLMAFCPTGLIGLAERTVAALSRPRDAGAQSSSKRRAEAARL
jgi:branched-chain amino acid transport system permease protein